MSSKNIVKRQKVKIFISYFAVFSITAVIFYTLCIISMNAVSSNIEKQSNLYNLNAAKNLTEDAMSRMRILINQVAGKKWLDDYIFMQDSDTEDINVFKLHEACNNLKMLSLSTDSVSAIGVYFNGPGLVIDNFNSYNMKEYFNKYYKVRNINISRWCALAEGRSNFEIISTGIVEFRDKNINGITVIKTIPSNIISGKGFVFMLINENSIKKIIEPFNKKGMFCAVIDEAGNVVSSTDNLDKEAIPASLGNYEEGKFVRISSKSGYAFCIMKIENIPWKIILAVKDKPFSFAIGNNAGIFAAYIIVTLVIGMIMSYLLSHNNYKKISMLEELIIGDIPRQDKKSLKNEYALMNKNVDEMKSELLKLETLVESYSPIIYENFLHSLIKTVGKCDNEVVEKLCNSDGSIFIGVFYALSDNVKELFYSLKIEKVFGKNLKSIAKKVDVTYDSCNRAVIFIWLKDNCKSNAMDQIKEKIYSIAETIMERHNREVFFGMGNASPNIASIYDSYVEAVECLSYKVLTYGIDIPCKMAGESKIPDVELEYKLIDCVKTGRYDKIVEQAGLYLSGSNSETALLLYYKLASVLTKLAENDSGYINEQAASRLENSKDIRDLLMIYKDVCKKAEADVKPVNKDFKADVVKYIDKNFRDSNISLKMLKDRFNISFSMIDKIIEEALGVCFLEYLNRKRIDYSKNLLDSSDLSATKIGRMSGYNNDNTFIKNFKKYMNTTPGEYRKQKGFRK